MHCTVKKYRYFIFFVFCLTCGKLLAEPAPANIRQFELDKAIELQGEWLWKELLKGIAYMPANRNSSSMINQLPVSSSIRDGLNAIYTRCPLARDDDEVCTDDQFKDLAYAFSNQNQGWVSALTGSVFDRYSMLFSSLLFYQHGEELVNGGYYLYQIFSPIIFSSLKKSLNIVNSKARILPRKGIEWVQEKKLESEFKKFKKEFSSACRDNSNAKEIALGRLRESAPKVMIAAGIKFISDTLLRDRGGFYYFVQKYTDSTNAPYSMSPLSFMGRLVYSYGSPDAWFFQRMFWEYPDQTAKDFFNIPLDMSLFYSILEGIIGLDNKAIQSVSFLDSPAYAAYFTKYSKNQSGAFISKSNTPEGVVKKVRPIINSIHTCSIVTLDQAGTGYYSPAFYLTVCPHEKYYWFRLASDTQWYQSSAQALSSVITKLLTITHTRRVHLYTN